MAVKTLYLIDGSSFVYRAFYAIGQLSTSTGQPTNAIYGFTRILGKLINTYNPEYIAVTFDTGKPTFRHVQYEEYKAHRKPMPEELVSQIPWIKKIVDAYNIPLIEMEGYEADDVIATMAVRAEKEGFNVCIVTSDKDIMQLVNERITVLNPSKEDIVYNEDKIMEKYGVGPSMITQLLALTGDSSDNIPGVPGVGEKTAARLIRQYGGIEGIFNNLEEVSPKVKAEIAGRKEQILENLNLVTIKKDVPVDVQPEDCILKKPDINKLKDIFRELQFRALLKELLENEDVNDNSIHPAIIIKMDEAIKDLENVSIVSITREGIAYEKDKNLKFIDTTSAGEKILSQIAGDQNIKKYGYDFKLMLRDKEFSLKGSFFDASLAEAVLDSRIVEECPNLTVNVYKAVPELERKLIEEGLFDIYYKIELPLVEVLTSMEKKGIKLETGVLKELSKEIEKDLGHLTEKIYKLAGEPFNINSPKQLECILFEKLKLPKGRRTKTGYSTDIDVLEKLSKYHELPNYVVEYRQLSKLKGTYIEPLPQLINPETGRLHTTFNQIGAVTGRISSANPNLQNIPIKTDLGKRIRRAFIPESDEFVLLGADYSQIELRVLAHMCGDKALVKAFQEGKDIHTETAQEIFGVSGEEVIPEMRRQAKIVNFGIIYGMGAKALAESLSITIHDAQKFMDTYMERYPGVRVYIEDELKAAKEHGYVVTMFGRKRKVPELQSSQPQIESLGRRIAINTPIQGAAADIIKMAMINIYRKIQEEKLGAYMLLQVHDELIFEVWRDSVEEAEKLIKREMENVVQLKVPLQVDVKIGRSWADL